jgi:hypothetical protein
MAFSFEGFAAYGFQTNLEDLFVFLTAPRHANSNLPARTWASPIYQQDTARLARLPSYESNPGIVLVTERRVILTVLRAAAREVEMTTDEGLQRGDREHER